MMRDHSAGEEVRLNFHGFRYSWGREFLEVSYAESPNRGMLIWPGPDRETYIDFHYARPSRYLTARKHRGALRIPWIDPKSLAFEQGLHDMKHEYVKSGGGSQYSGHMDQFKGRVIVILYVPDCLNAKNPAIEVEIQKVFAKYKQAPVSIFGISGRDWECPFEDRDKNDFIQKLPQIALSSPVNSYIARKYPHGRTPYETYIFDQGGQFSAAIGGNYEFNREALIRIVDSLLAY
jgi:hypothetical protein